MAILRYNSDCMLNEAVVEEIASEEAAEEDAVQDLEPECKTWSPESWSTVASCEVGRELCSRDHQRLLTLTVHDSQKLFGNELGANPPGEHFFVSWKGCGAEGAASCLDLRRRAHPASSHLVHF